ncbi:MAG: hypothetical protein KGH64_00595 [Candidatus Micrarchaeota archaeon]|nr:hypothetical protein [Candidatus Micrarchaeota archaeon]
MIVNKNSWHYKVYKFSYLGVDYPSESTNLCQYVRRITIVVPVIGAAVLTAVLIVVLSNPIFFIAGRYLKMPWQGASSMERYQGLRLGTFELYPWHILLPTLIVIGEFFLVRRLGWVYPVAVPVAFASVMLCALGVAYFFKQRSSTKPSLLGAWLKAKKERVCPLINFEE